MNNHANGIAQGTLAGELVTILPHQLLFVKDVEKIWSLKRQVSLESRNYFVFTIFLFLLLYNDIQFYVLVEFQCSSCRF